MAQKIQGLPRQLLELIERKIRPPIVSPADVVHPQQKKDEDRQKKPLVD
jgi:hypothetical protein